MSRYILVLNCGSSSIKFAVIDPASGETCLSGIVERINTPEAVLNWRAAEVKQQDIPNADYETALAAIIQILREQGFAEQLTGIGHRVVHGGEKFSESILICAEVVAQIEANCRLAPLHNPSNLQGILAAQKAFPQLLQAAVFDTAFHQTIPQHAYLYPLPQKFYQQYSVRRYGFHGISYRYVSQQAMQRLGLSSNDNALLIAHLGNGCSATAVFNGNSIDTSMGMTPLEGLMMGTRTGDVDPGLHGYLAAECQLTLDEITAILNKQSGLLGVSGLSMDMRTLQQAAGHGNVDAQLAITMFCYRLAKYLGALAMTLPRIDALVFTGGIGENAMFVRVQVLKQLAILGFVIDEQHNQEHGKNNNGIITQANSTCAMVIATNEELMIAQDVNRLVTSSIAK